MKMKSRNQENSKQFRLLLFASLLVSFLIGVYAPLEIYANNIGEFWFEITEMLPVVGGMFVVLTLVLIAMGKLLPKRVSPYYALMLLGVGIAIYLQGNYLNLNVSRLNGSYIDWDAYRDKMILNVVIWAIVIILPIVLRAVKKIDIVKIGTYIAGFLLVMQVVVLATVIVMALPNQQKKTGVLSEKNMFALSKNKNVVVFVLDMFDNEYMRKLIDEKPEVKEMFSDFTFFDNAVGSYSSTTYSMGVVFTGQRNLNEGASYEHSVDLEYENTETFDELMANNFAIDVYANLGIPTKLRQKLSNYVYEAPHVSDWMTYTKCIYHLSLCKYGPDILKPQLWMDGTEFERLKYVAAKPYLGYADNLVFKESLDQAKYKLTNENRFKLIHIKGVHYPYDINSNFERIEPTYSDAAVMDVSIASLMLVREYMDHMMELGVYENAQIIVMADHGYYWDGVLTNPLIMVKEPGTREEFAISRAPVSSYDLHGTIMGAMGLNDDEKYGKSMFDIAEDEQRTRYFCQYNLQEPMYASKFRLIEYEITEVSNARKNFVLTGIDYNTKGERVDHFANCVYCQENGTDPVDAPNSQRIVHLQK